MRTLAKSIAPVKHSSRKTRLTKGFEPLSVLIPRTLALISQQRQTAEARWLKRSFTAANSLRLDKLIEAERAVRSLIEVEK